MYQYIRHALLAAALLAAGSAQAFNVSITNSASSSGGNWESGPQGTVWRAQADSVVSRQELLDRLQLDAVTVAATGNGADTLTVDAPLAWGAHPLSLRAGGSIRINASMGVTGTGGLALEWGQADVDRDVDSDWGYFLGEGVKIDLGDHTSFQTRSGSDGYLLDYTIVTREGTDLAGPYDPNGLQWMGSYVALGADVDASGTPWWNNGRMFVPHYVARFAGLGHAIDGLAMRAYTQFVPDASGRSTLGGLFTTVHFVQDLRLTGLKVDVQDGSLIGGVAGVLTGRMRNVHASGQVLVDGSSQNQSIGGLVGHSWGRISDSSSAVTVTAERASNVGGLAGTLQAHSGRSALIERSRNTGAVTGSRYVGGLVGSMEAADYLEGTLARIVASHNTGTVRGTTFMDRIGGLAGASNKADIVDSSSVATVTTDNSRGEFVGGLVGEAWGAVVWNSYSGGLVRGLTSVGGLVGSMIPQRKRFSDYVGSVEHSFSAASVVHDTADYAASSIGGLVGEARGVKIAESFSVGPVSVLRGTNVGGLVGWLRPYWTETTPFDRECQGVAIPGGVWVDVSYSLSPITVDNGTYVGGLVGLMEATGDRNLHGLCPARVSESFAAGRMSWGGASSAVFRNFGGLIGRYNPANAESSAEYAITKSWFHGDAVRLWFSDGGNSANEMRGERFELLDPWQVGTVWDFRLGSRFYPALINARHPLQAQMRAETTYTGSASAWNGITPALTYTLDDGMPIPAPGVAPLIDTTGLSIGAMSPGWQAGTYEQPVAGLQSSQFTLGTSGALTVKKAPLTVRALPVNKTYDGTAFSPDASQVEITGFVGGEGASVLQGALTFSGGGVGARNAGSYTLTPGGFTASNYDIAYLSAPLAIAPTPITLAPVADVKVYDGTAYSAKLPAITSGVLRAGDTLTNLGQVFDNPNAGARQIGLAPGYAINDGNGGRNYQVTVGVPVAGAIEPAALFVRALNVTKPKDDVPYVGGGGVQFYGFVNGEDATVLAGTLAYGGTSQGATTMGSYSIAPSGLGSANYAVQYVNGTLTISNRALIVRAKDMARTYDGSAYSGGNDVTYTGFEPGDDESVLQGTLAYGGTSQGAKNAGSYTIEPSGLTAPGYDIVFQPGTLAIARAPLTIQADSHARPYNRVPFTEFTVTPTGFVNGEGLADLQGTLTYRLRTCSNCWVDTPPLAGSYGIVPSGLTSANYAISYVPGNLNIAKLPLTITVLGATKPYDGQPFAAPGLGGMRIEGFLPGDTLEQQVELRRQLENKPNAALTTAYGGTGPGNPMPPAAVGSYTVQGRYLFGGAAINGNAFPGYTVANVNGTYTITPAPLTITANDDTRPEGGAPYSGGNGVQYGGFVNGETSAVLTGTVDYGGSSQGASAKGRYAITPKGQTAANYAITYVSGQLTVGNPGGNTITVTAADGGQAACTPNPVDDGQNATCTATPASGYRFTGWGGDCAASGTTTTCTLADVRVPKNVTAGFAPITTHGGTTVPTAGTGGVAGAGSASFTGGGNACRFDPAATGFEAAPATPPTGQVLPQGMFRFKLIGCDTGVAPVTMRVTWPQAISGYTKHGKAASNAPDASYFAPPGLTLDPDGHTASFTLTDGQLGDDDWQQNGEITDPAGPVALAGAPLPPPPLPAGPPAAIPTLSQWGVLLLSALSGLWGLAALRRRNSS